MNVPVSDPVSAIAHRIAAEWFRTHRVRTDGRWWQFDPVGSAPLAQQGWKLHVSTDPRTAAETLRRVALVLLGRGVRWKSVRSVAHLANLASPPSPPSQAGKFITAYPDPDDVAALAGELHAATADLTGPVITSDRRYARGSNVYLRYGAFTGKVSYAGADQVRTLVLHSPDGAPVPDSRAPGAYRPDWADDPLPPLPPVPRPGGHGLFGRGTRITGVLRSSVRGGVFRGEHEGRPVVVKEGRAGTNPDLLGRDSVDRLRNEWRLLRRLSGTGLAPEPVDFFVEEGNAYLIAEFLPGMTLRKRINQDNYRGGAEPVLLHARCRAVIELAAGLRAHGLELRDFTPNNIMVDGDRLTAIDLELYSLVDSPEPPFAGWTPGYGAAGRVDPDFGVAATVHFVLTGVDPYVGSGHDAAPHIPALLAAFAPDLPDEHAFVLRHLAPAATAVDTAAESALEDAVATGDELVERTEWDRGPWPWPSGWATDTFHPACFHTGAAGVAHFYLDLFRAAGERRWAEHAGDLLSRIAVDTPIAPGSTPLGLHFGIGSLPWLLAETAATGGPRAAPLRAQAAGLSRALAELDPGSWDITHGWAGLGMAQLGTLLATGDLDGGPRVHDAADRLIAAVQERDGIPVWPRGNDAKAKDISLGYAHGTAGIAHFLLLAGHLAGHRDALALALLAARAIAGAAEPTTAGLSWSNDSAPGSPLWTHWCNGSAGVGRFLLSAARASGDGDLLAAARGAGRAISGGRAYGSTCRCHGLAGDADYLLDLGEPDAVDGATRIAAKLAALRVRRGRTVSWVQESGDTARPAYMRGHLGVHAFRLRLAGLLRHSPLTVPGDPVTAALDTKAGPARVPAATVGSPA